MSGRASGKLLTAQAAEAFSKQCRLKVRSLEPFGEGFRGMALQGDPGGVSRNCQCFTEQK